MLKIGGKYNFKHQDVRLIYLGKNGEWHQFSKTEAPTKVWAECLEKDLYLIEETKK